MTTPSDEPDSPLEGAQKNRPSVRVVPRYLLFQLPGWIVAVTASAVGGRWWDFPLWICIAIPLETLESMDQTVGRIIDATSDASEAARTIRY